MQVFLKLTAKGTKHIFMIAYPSLQGTQLKVTAVEISLAAL